MKVSIALVLLLMLVACSPREYSAGSRIETGNANVTFWHDDERKVSCWLFWGTRKGGISCIPDHLLKE